MAKTKKLEAEAEQKVMRDHLVSTICEIHRSEHPRGLSGEEIISTVYRTLLELINIRPLKKGY